jgi:hypothetical protein
MSRILNVGDEEGFSNYAEKVVFELQNLWRAKEGMEYVPVIEMSSKLEDLIYQEALAEMSLSSTANVWGKKECIMYYQETCDKMLKSLEFKHLGWKKLFEDNEKNPKAVLNAILKDEDGRKQKLVSMAPKTIKLPRQMKPKAVAAARASLSGGGGKSQVGSKHGGIKTGLKSVENVGGIHQYSVSHSASSIAAAVGLHSYSSHQTTSDFHDDIQPIGDMSSFSDTVMPENNLRLERMISDASIDGLGFDFDGDDSNLMGAFSGAINDGVVENEQDWYNVL